AMLSAAGIEVISGVLTADAYELNPGFIKRMEQQRPFVRVKMATSLDGRTALASGESKWITGESSRKDVQYWRAKSSAILTGIGTVLADDPSLTVRLSAAELAIQGEVRQPLRVILDSQLRCPASAKLLSLPGETLIYTQRNCQHTIQALESAGAEVVVIGQDEQTVPMSLSLILTDLATREINEIHTEAGAKLCGSLLAQGLADELLLYMAPHLLGGDALGAFALPPLKTMHDRIDLKIKDMRAIGDDWRIIATLANKQV
ncbi:MAG: bifunctional diaminohydroxyphosphoribosylaminopyrimidine deaminase/5-amino-6-(5-phosphoribosylamino)uracil reductase RibD, partial [Leucothrix sp.]